MLPLLVTLMFSLLVSLTSSTPVSMAQLEAQFGNYKDIVDITRASAIFDEEARRLGVTAQEHFIMCKEPSIPLILFYQENGAVKAAQHLFPDFEAVKQESVFLKKRKFHTAAEMVEAAKTEAPKTYAAATQLVRNFRTKYVNTLEEPAKTFANQLVDAYIQLEWSAISTFDHNERQAKVGIISNKVGQLYQALPQSSKDNIDKVFCTATALRLVGSKWGSYGWPTKMQDAALFMWTPILLILLVSLTHSTSVSIEDIQKQYSNYKNLFNVSRAQSVFDEEAKRLGITPHEHFNACKEPSHPLIMWWTGNPIRSFAFLLSEEDIETINSELPRYAGHNVNTTEDFLKFMKKVTPKSLEILKKRVFAFKAKYLDKLDVSSRKFMDQLGEKIFDMLVTKRKDLLDKCFDSYAALPQSAKDDIDKLFCARTVLRLFEVDGDSSPWISALKNILPTY